MIGHVRIYGPVEQTAGLLNLKLLLMAAWTSERGNISRHFWTGSAASLSDRRFTIMYLQIKFPICENKMMDPGVVLCENECAVTCLVNRFSAIKLQTLVIWSWTPWSTNHLQLTWCRLECSVEIGRCEEREDRGDKLLPVVFLWYSVHSAESVLPGDVCSVTKYHSGHRHSSSLHLASFWKTWTS